jgi:outer membrane receptor protein involved in Fe transport
VRYQRQTLFEDVVLASGQAVIGPHLGTVLKFNYSEGMRTPQLWAAYGTADLYTRVTPLRLERSRAAQVQVTSTPLRELGPLDSLRLALAYTYSRVDNLVLYGSSPVALAILVRNGDTPLEVHSIDAEAEVRSMVARAWLRLTYNRYDERALQMGLVAIPGSTYVVNGGAAVALWARRQVWLQAAVVGLGPVAPPAGLGLEARDAVALIEAGVTALRLWANLEVGVFARNLADVRWAQPNLVPAGAIPGGGVPQAGRTFYARVAWTWR